MLSTLQEWNMRGNHSHSVFVHKFIDSLRDYLPELERARAARDKSLQNIKDESMNRLMKDLEIDQQHNPALKEKWDAEVEDEDEDEDVDVDLIDRCMLSFFLSNDCSCHRACSRRTLAGRVYRFDEPKRTPWQR